jgi:hypothetical protein
MKKLFALLVMVGMLAGCGAGGGGQVINQDVAIQTAIQLAAYNLGFYVADKHPEYDPLIADAYTLARTGTMTPEQMAAALANLKLQNPQLTGSLMIVLSSMGASITQDGGIVGLSGIPVAYWDAAAKGYTMGFEMAQANKKAITVSAVKAKMPKK